MRITKKFGLKLKLYLNYKSHLSIPKAQAIRPGHRFLILSIFLQPNMFKEHLVKNNLLLSIMNKKRINKTIIILITMKQKTLNSPQELKLKLIQKMKLIHPRTLKIKQLLNLKILKKTLKMKKKKLTLTLMIQILKIKLIH